MDYAEDALKLSNYAIQRDKNGRYVEAIYYYKEACRLLYLARVLMPNHPDAKSWNDKESCYLNRIKDLEEISKQPPRAIEPTNTCNVHVGRCYFLFKQALDADESGNINDALQLYVQAVETVLKTKNKISDASAKEKLQNIAVQALDRGEQLKAKITNNVTTNTKKDSVSTDLGFLRESSSHLKVTGDDTYTEEDKRVLLITSFINKNEYVPFMKIDLEERFQYAIPFTDENGLLKLSPKQKQYFARWIRPPEYCRNPRVVSSEHVNYLNIKQTIVSDCSFVASLTVAAHYEKKFGCRLISSIIFPKKRNGEPVYNPFGKYMVKFHINGIDRKVVIDDQLPLGKNNELLCSYSIDPNELWVSLLEKAYMKVMGGYDFPGSHSNIDLHTLTGWIPERCAIKNTESGFDADSQFNMMLTRLHKGDVLITVATGELSEVDANHTGLVSDHAYAIIDIRRIKDKCLMRLKNPWSNIRWRGNYSELDTVHWTPEMKLALNYNPDDATTFDNGIFWIDYASVLHFFNIFYMNWNPALFSHTFDIHRSWSVAVGPIKDSFNIGENPQFCLDVSDCKNGVVWILLTRHITELSDFKDNNEYITVIVYKTNGKRVYYPYDPAPYIDGVRINSPHYLCKIILTETSSRYFTLVISRYEKVSTIYYTLQAFATCPFHLQELTTNYKYEQNISDGQWKGITAGGCKNYPATYNNNPVYQIDVKSSHNNNSLLIDIKGPKEYQLGIDVTLVKLHNDAETAKFKTLSSGDYRSGFVVLDLNEVQPGLYNIVPSTFYPSQDGPFILTVKSSCPITIKCIT